MADKQQPNDEFRRRFQRLLDDAASAARLNRHDLHPWARKAEGCEARAVCRRCGALVDVKLTAHSETVSGSALHSRCQKR